MKHIPADLSVPVKSARSFRPLKDAWIDTTSPPRSRMLTVLGGLADFERDLIAARTGEGRKRGRGSAASSSAGRGSSPHINGRRLLLGYARSVQGTDFTVSASVPEGNRPAEFFSMWSILTIPIGSHL